MKNQTFFTGKVSKLPKPTVKAYCCCDCGYETNCMNLKDLLLKLCNEGGYITSDKEGGYYSKCPKCGSENLEAHFE